MPLVMDWKAQQLAIKSEAYKSDSLANTNGLMQAGISQARIAMLMVPEEIEFHRNYVELLIKEDPTKGLLEWEKLLERPEAKKEDRRTLIRHCLQFAGRQKELSRQNPMTRMLAMTVAKRQLSRLNEESEPNDDSPHALLQAEFLAESGEILLALNFVLKILADKQVPSPEAIFLYAKIATNVGDKQRLGEAGRLLAGLAQKPDEVGLEAIRHMALIHTALPLASKGLENCLKLLKLNKKAETIDYLRIHALRLDSAAAEHEKTAILQECSELFDLEDNRQLLQYCRWLGRMHVFPRILEEIPPAKARLEDDLFKLRMSALAATKSFQEMKNELSNAPAISMRWKLTISARVHAISGDFEKSAEALDQLLSELDKNTGLIFSTCRYLEASGDIRSLCHLLKRLIDEPGIKQHALEKLLEYHGSSASLRDLRLWIGKLREIHAEDPKLLNAELYFGLLDTDNTKESIERITSLAVELQAQHTGHNYKITAALAHLLSKNPDKALLALGNPAEWRNFRETRPAWTFICAQTLRLNQETQRAISLEQELSFESMDRAERNALASLFPKSFPKSRE